MTEVTDEHKRTARRNAIIAVACVAVFTAAFIGLLTLLDQISRPAVEDDIDVENAVFVSQDPFYVLLIGSDSRKGTALYTGKANEHGQVDQHSDILTLMRIDPDTYTITLVTIPRDTVISGETAKINDSLLQNKPEDVVASVEKLTGVEVSDYIMVSFTQFEDLVDALGGVTVDVPKTVTLPDPATGKDVTVKAGKDKKLNGAQALVLARSRKEYDDFQDALRQVNVRNIEQALIQKVLNRDDDIDIERVLTVLEDSTRNDMDLVLMGQIMLDFMDHADYVTFYSCTGPYEGDNRKSDGEWVVPARPTTWNLIMRVVDAGQDPSDIVEVPKF